MWWLQLRFDFDSAAVRPRMLKPYDVTPADTLAAVTLAYLLCPSLIGGALSDAFV